MTGTRPRTRGASRRRRSMGTAVATALSLAVLTTACIDVEMDFLIHDDGAGSVIMTISVDEAVLEFAALEAGGAAEDLCDEMLGDMDADDTVDLGLGNLDSTAETVLVDGSCIATTTSTWSASQSEEVLAALAEDDGPSIRRLDDGGWRFEVGAGSLEDEELTPDDLEMVTALGFDLPTATISVTLPGDAVEHNADSAIQSKYTWEIPFDALDELPETIYVETAPGGGGLGPAAIGGIVAAIVLALAALVTLRRHREARASESEDVESDPDSTDVENSQTADEVSDSGKASDDAANGDSLESDDGDDDPAERSTET